MTQNPATTGAAAPATYDYSADRPAASTDSLQTITRLAYALVEATVARDAASEALDRAQALVDQLSQRDLPEAMAAAGQKAGLVTDAGVIDVKPTVRVNIPAATKDRTFDWLDQNGHGAIVKRTIEVPFGRDTEQDALVLLDGLREAHPDARMAKKVEPSTLSAWVRQQRELAGTLPPPELLTVHDMPVASVKAKK